MTEPLSTAVAGLNNAAARIAKASNVIANTSLITADATNQTASQDPQSTPATIIQPSAAAIVGQGDVADLTSALVSIAADSAVYGANAKVISAVKKNEDALINVKV